MDWMYTVFYLIGGLAIFLYGMRLLSEGLQKTAGDRLRTILERFTGNRLKGLATGAVFTSIVQSSSLTTVTLVGLISGGVMTLGAAVPVIMGANIGTTVTAQIIAFKITQISLPAIGLGFLLMSLRKGRYAPMGQTVMGFGFLFLGMMLMSQGVDPLKTDPMFEGFLAAFSASPLLAVLAGALFTAVIQSSSATSGLVIAMASSGLLTLGAAIPLLLGANIGTCVTVVLASVGTCLASKRAALAHVVFNILGVLMFLPFLPAFTGFVASTGTDLARQVANAHLIFNLATTLALLPFAGALILLIKRLLPGEEIRVENGTKFINRNLLGTPALALKHAEKEAVRMGQMVVGMMDNARRLVMDGKAEHADVIAKKEDAIDHIHTALNRFLDELSERRLTSEQSQTRTMLAHCASDIERTSDHLHNLSKYGAKKLEAGIVFSEEAVKSLDLMFRKSKKSISEAVRVLAGMDKRLAESVLHLEAEIDVMKKQMTEAHVRRLEAGDCDIRHEPVFLNIITHLERVSDHAHNIVNAVTFGF